MNLCYRVLLIVLCTAGLMTGCASSPPVELHVARYAVETARNEGAQSYATAELSQATTALQRGETLLSNGRHDKAVATLQQATQWAITAKSKARAQRQTIQQYSSQCEALEAEQRLYSLQKKLQTSHDQLSVVAPTPPRPRPETSPQQEASVAETTLTTPLTEYRVGTGENLYSIAARRAIYGEGLLWPLLYRANRDQIKDPQQIFPGQILSVPRNHTEEERESARETARSSGIFLP
nr:DUF4398 domain-containing protein [uncultured Desulfuromonas sp.]